MESEQNSPPRPEHGDGDDDREGQRKGVNTLAPDLLRYPIATRVA